MLQPGKQLVLPLGDGLTLRSAVAPVDIDRFAAFNTAINDATQGATCAALFADFPGMTGADFLLVNDATTGAVVSTTCLIPWQVRLGNCTLDVAMLEMVATHPDYRRRGLVRRQIEHFHAVTAARGFDLCIIEGIPYYYRQFGYVYARDHWADDLLAASQVPATVDGPQLHLRPATPDDIPHLMRLAVATTDRLDLATVRDEAGWRYLLHGAAYPVTMLEDATTRTLLGYLVGWRRDGLWRIIESGIPAADTALALLAHLRRAHPGDMVLGWPVQSTLLDVARSLGSRSGLGDQWLWRWVDLPALLVKLAPLLAARLAASPYAGLTADLILNLYTTAYRLRFAAGQLDAVESLGFVDASMGADGGDLCIPPAAFMRLLLGYRTLDELFDAWPDIMVRTARRGLWHVLWPRLDGYVWMPYVNLAEADRIG